MNEEPKLSPELRVQLSQIFLLGFLDAMKGEEVQDGDLVEGLDAAGLERVALACIAGAEDQIQAAYPENPQMVHNRIYALGQSIYGQIERWVLQRN